MSTAHRSRRRRDESCESQVEPEAGETGVVSMGALRRAEHMNLTLNAQTLSPRSTREGDTPL